jgi:hypothetical protein
MARAGFGLLSVLLSLPVIGLLGAVVLTITGFSGNAAGLSASLFATPGGMMSRCDVSGAPPPASPSSGRGCRGRDG